MLRTSCATKTVWRQRLTARIALQAAVLAHGIAEGQVFVDGNKTTALLAMLAFLDINGFTLSGPDDPELAQWILDLSDGLTAEVLADRIRGVLIIVS